MQNLNSTNTTISTDAPSTKAVSPLRLLANSKSATTPGSAQVAVKAHKKNRSQLIQLTSIRTDGGTRARIDVNAAVTAEYTELMKGDVTFFPVTVFFDGSDYWLADGFYRVAAALQLGCEDIKAYIHEGTQRDAQLFAIEANKAHGARYTTADKRHTVLTLLNDAEWSAWSNYEIARHCGVTDGTVRKYRTEVEEKTAENTQKRRYMKGGKSFEMILGGLSSKGAGTAKSTTIAPTSEPVIDPQAFEMASHLPLFDDAAQVSLLLTLSAAEQKQVVEKIEMASNRGRYKSMVDAVSDLRKEQQVAAQDAARAKRIEAALQAGLDDDFVCGDCTDVLQRLEHQSVRLLLADGPYGIKYQSRAIGSTEDRIANDGTPEEALDIHRRMLAAIEPAMMPDCHVMLFCDKKLEPEFRQIVQEAGYEYKDSLIWDKGDSGRPIPNQAFRRHERIIWFTKGNPQLTSSIADVLCHARPSRSVEAPDTSHLTPKPVSLLAELISATTVEGEQVVDPFAGSASTLVTAKMLGRRYFGSEMNKDWYREGMARLVTAQASEGVSSLSISSDATGDISGQPQLVLVPDSASYLVLSPDSIPSIVGASGDANVHQAPAPALRKVA